MLPAHARLRASTDFAAVLRGGPRSRQGGPLIVVHAASTAVRAGRPARVGLVVSRAVGGAVTRNRTKRVLRAVLAGRLPHVPDGTDLVVRATPAAAGASSARLAAEVDRLLPAVLLKLRDRAGGPAR